MLGYKDANSETPKCRPMALYILHFYALCTNFWFGFCKNTEKLPNNKYSDLQ